MSREIGGTDGGCGDEVIGYASERKTIHTCSRGLGSKKRQIYWPRGLEPFPFTVDFFFIFPLLLLALQQCRRLYFIYGMHRIESQQRTRESSRSQKFYITTNVKQPYFGCCEGNFTLAFNSFVNYTQRSAAHTNVVQLAAC